MLLVFSASCSGFKVKQNRVLKQMCVTKHAQQHPQSTHLNFY